MSSWQDEERQAKRDALAAEQERMRKLIGRGVKVGIGVAAVGFGLMLGPWFTVPQNQVAVVTNFGKLDYVAGPGIHPLIPFVQSPVYIRTSVEGVSLDRLNTYTQDSQELTANVRVQWQIPASAAAAVYTHLGTSYADKIDGMVVSRFKDVIGKQNAIDVPSHRAEIQGMVLKIVQAEAARLYDGIQITDFQITNFDWNDSYRQAINAASVAKAQVEQAEQAKRSAEVQAEQRKAVAEIDAQRDVAVAEGKAKAQRVQAEAQAYATLQQGEADAKSIQVMGDAVAKNPAFVQFKWAQNWNGQMPQAIYGSAPIPFIGGGK